MNETTKTYPSEALRLRDIPRYDPEDLQGEVLHVGQFANLMREEYVDAHGNLWLVRWWVNRVGSKDGARFPVEVEARLCPDGSWFDVGAFGEFEDYA